MSCSHCPHCTERERQLAAVDAYARANEIVDMVALRYHVRRAVFFSRSRKQHVAFARFMVFYLIREDVGLTWPAIGKFLRHDHSTAIHGHGMIIKRMAREPAFAKEVARLRERIEGEVKQVA